MLKKMKPIKLTNNLELIRTKITYYICEVRDMFYIVLIIKYKLKLNVI